MANKRLATVPFGTPNPQGHANLPLSFFQQPPPAARFGGVYLPTKLVKAIRTKKVNIAEAYLVAIIWDSPTNVPDCYLAASLGVGLRVISKSIKRLVKIKMIKIKNASGWRHLVVVPRLD